MDKHLPVNPRRCCCRIDCDLHFAAPELAEALKEIAELFEINVTRRSPNFPRGEKALTGARAALLKAGVQ